MAVSRIPFFTDMVMGSWDPTCLACAVRRATASSLAQPVTVLGPGGFLWTNSPTFTEPS